MDSRRHLPAISPVIGAMLLVGITAVLSALVYLLVIAGPSVGLTQPRLQYMRIVTVRQAGDPFTDGCDDSCVILLHEGNAPLRNDDLSAVVLRNNEKLKANITTMNAYLFYWTKHDGVAHISGPGAAGSKGSTWDPGEEIWIDLNDKSLKAGDLVTVRIIDKTSNLVISEDTARV